MATTTTTYVEQPVPRTGPMYESAAPVYDAGVGNGSAYKGTDDVSELRRRVQYLEERMTHSEPAGAGLSSKSLAEAVGTTPSSHASVVANPAPLGLFAFGLTTAMLSVRFLAAGYWFGLDLMARLG